MNSTQADLVRKHFRDIVRRRTGLELPPVMLETTLIRAGSYCGRRFSLQGYSLIWFVDEQRVKLFAQDGSLLESTSTDAFCQIENTTSSVIPMRRAA